jgi:acyl carrier protein
MDIEQRIFQVLKQTLSITLSWENWTTLDSIKEWTSMDSMAILEFIAGLEQEFHYRFPAQDLSTDLFTNRSHLVLYLAEKVHED